MKKIYLPGRGGAFRSLLTTPNIYTYIDKDNYADNLVSVAENISQKKPKHFTSLNELKDLLGCNDPIEIEVYAFDEETVSHLKKMLDIGFKLKYKKENIDVIYLNKVLDVTKTIRDKSFFYKLINSLFPEHIVPKAKTLKASGISDLILTGNLSFPIIIKSTAGKGGKGNLVCYNHEDLNNATEILSYEIFSQKSEYGENVSEGVFIVEPFLPKARSFNISFQCPGNEIYINEQISEEVFYRGNRSLDGVPVEIVINIKEKICEIQNKLLSLGAKGWIGIDVLYNNGNFFFLECNPRVNSSTHIQHLLGSNSVFEMELYDVGDKTTTLDVIKSLGGKIYNPKTREGLLPYSLVEKGRVLILRIYKKNHRYLFLRTQDILTRLYRKTAQVIASKTNSKSLSYYLLSRNKKTDITHYICISTEDHLENVKGGIGTYLGVLTRGIKKIFPSVSVEWFTESATQQHHIESDHGCTLHYLSRYDGNTRLNVDIFAIKIKTKIMNRIREILIENPNAKIVLEVPDWEGLGHDLFFECNTPNVLRVTRVHSPLLHTSALSGLLLEQEKTLQVEMESKQFSHSDMISSPTKYILRSTKEYYPSISESHKSQECIIPNCIDNNGFGNKPKRYTAIQRLRELGIDINFNTFNIFVIGSVEKRKGIDIILKSLTEIFKNIPEARVYFFGHIQEGENEITANSKYTRCSLNYELQRLKIPTEKVYIHGYLDHKLLSNAIGAGDAFPICYLGDNFPGVVAELALNKAPIISTVKGGIKEMVTDDDGEILVEEIKGRTLVETSENCAKAIIRVHEWGPDIKNIEKLQRLFVNSYNPGKVVSSMMRTYSNALCKKYGV